MRNFYLQILLFCFASFAESAPKNISKPARRNTATKSKNFITIKDAIGFSELQFPIPQQNPYGDGDPPVLSRVEKSSDVVNLVYEKFQGYPDTHRISLRRLQSIKSREDVEKYAKKNIHTHSMDVAPSIEVAAGTVIVTHDGGEVAPGREVAFVLIPGSDALVVNPTFGLVFDWSKLKVIK